MGWLGAALAGGCVTVYEDAPLMLQAHGDPGPSVSFRNIWLRPLP